MATSKKTKARSRRSSPSTAFSQFMQRNGFVFQAETGTWSLHQSLPGSHPGATTTAEYAVSKAIQTNGLPIPPTSDRQRVWVNVFPSDDPASLICLEFDSVSDFLRRIRPTV